MKNSAIQWCDHTFNPWEGCAKVAPECKNCYAETLVDHRFGRVKWGKGQPRRRTSANLWKQPLAWNREAGLCKCDQGIRAASLHDCSAGGYDVDYHTKMKRARVFCLSLGDWLDEEVPIEWLADLLQLIHRTPNLDWLLLTKRPQNFMQRLIEIRQTKATLENIEGCEVAMDWRNGLWPLNVWIGVSAGADQSQALAIPARIHFLSCEPMLHPIDHFYLPTQEFDWIIFGGESGKNPRPCRTDWIREGVQFCKRLQIACFVKQLGKNSLDPTEYPMMLKDSHGGDWDEWPEDLRIREFPADISVHSA